MLGRAISISKQAVIFGECDSLSVNLDFNDADFRSILKSRGYKWSATNKTWQIAKCDVKAELAFLFANGGAIWDTLRDSAEMGAMLGFMNVPAIVAKGELNFRPESKFYSISETSALSNMPAWEQTVITVNPETLNQFLA